MILIADLVQKVNPQELGVMRFTAVNTQESSERWQHIVRDSDGGQGGICIHNSTFLLYVLAQSLCHQVMYKYVVHPCHVAFRNSAGYRYPF